MFLIQSNLLQTLEKWDQWLFIQINDHLSNSFFDSIMPFIRSQYLWPPLYLFLLVFVLHNFKSNVWWWIILFICLVSLTDMTSSQLIKYAFHRIRPCRDPDFFEHVRLLVNNCSGTYSFTSSHAANHFGMATFMFLTLRPRIGKWIWLAFIWAAVISYAQVYVGVHYPFDVLGGAAIGFAFGWLFGSFFNKRLGFANFEQ